jgi:hypothetical protein
MKLILTVCEKIYTEDGDYYEPTKKLVIIEINAIHVEIKKGEKHDSDSSSSGSDSDSDDEKKKEKIVKSKYIKHIILFCKEDFEDVKKFVDKYLKYNRLGGFFIVIEEDSNKIYRGKNVDLDSNTLTITDIEELEKEEFKKST